jgi:predicted dehydrogenase
MSRHPSAHVTSNPEELMSSPEIDAVAIVTPVSTHYALAKRALENGKHVFVEKPFTATSAQAEELIELADRKNLQIMVDHTFLFTGAVRKIKELIDGGVLGPLYYYDSTRVNLGLFQHDVNVIWDLAPHDLSILDHLIGLEPELVIATGGAHLNGMEDMAYLTLYFPGNIIAHINVNWLSPVKVRLTLVGGQRKMLVWNDLEPGEKIKVYDKGADVDTKQAVHELLVSYRSGDMWAPRVEEAEALQLEARYFLDCVDSGEKPFNDGRAGLRVVRILEAADESLRRRREIVLPSSRRPEVEPMPSGSVQLAV